MLCTITPLMNQIDKSIRLTNFLVDYFIILICWFCSAILSLNQIVIDYGYFVITFLYYLISEWFFKRTVGKIITNTTVIKKNGGPATFVNILFRTTLRLIPIDSFSYLFGAERGLHDVLSSTRIIKKNKITLHSKV